MSDGTADAGNRRLDDSGEEASVAVIADGEPPNVIPESDSGADASSAANDATETKTNIDGGVNSNFDQNAVDESDDSSSTVAKALSSMLSSVIRDFDCKAEDAVRSQDQLCFAMDRLTRELDQLLEDAPLPFLMQHAAKISGVRKRVSSLNLLLKSIQRRLDNVDRVLFVGLPHEKAASESA